MACLPGARGVMSRPDWNLYTDGPINPAHSGEVSGRKRAGALDIFHGYHGYSTNDTMVFQKSTYIVLWKLLVYKQ